MNIQYVMVGAKKGMLVLFCKAKSESQTKLYFEKLISMRTLGVKTLDGMQYEFYQNWYNSAIRAVIQFFKFEGDYDKLANSLTPKITMKEAKESVALLESLQLIKKDEAGSYSVTDQHISAGKEYKPIAIRTFQRQTIDLAKKSLSLHAPDIRDISTLTIGIDEEALMDISDIIRECRSAIQKRISEIESPDSVYQVNFQVFPMCIADGGEK